MATAIARLQALADALIDGTATDAQQSRAASAFVEHWRNEIISLDYEPENLSNAARATFMLRKIKQFVADIVRIELAKDAQAAVQSTVDTAAARSDTDWPDESI